MGHEMGFYKQNNDDKNDTTIMTNDDVTCFWKWIQ